MTAHPLLRALGVIGCLFGQHRWRVRDLEHLGRVDWYVGRRAFYCTRCLKGLR